MSLILLPQDFSSWEEEETLVPTSSEEAESLRRKRALVQRMTFEKQVPEEEYYDGVFDFSH
jgi:hypothetical protein